MVFIVLGIFILALVTYFLFAPLFIEIDSTQGLMRLRFHRLAAASLTVENDSLWLCIYVTFWRKDMDLLETVFSPKAKTAKPKKKARKLKSKATEPGRIFRKAWGILNSFQIQECLVRLNTGNAASNGMLYPAFYLLGKITGRDILITFHEEEVIILKIRNNMARMLWAYIKS